MLTRRFMIRMADKGFTLIELMVVIIIIGILASITIPSFNKTIDNAREREARTTLQLIYNAENVYRLDKKLYAQVNDISNAEWAKLASYIENPNNTAKYYNYKIDTVDNVVAPPTFKATATKNSDAAKTITIDQAGALEPQ